MFSGPNRSDLLVDTYGHSELEHIEFRGTSLAGGVLSLDNFLQLRIMDVVRLKNHFYHTIFVRTGRRLPTISRQVIADHRPAKGTVGAGSTGSSASGLRQEKGWC